MFNEIGQDQAQTAIFWILASLTSIFAVLVAISTVAILIILAGPPDAHDVEIEGKIKSRKGHHEND